MDQGVDLGAELAARVADFRTRAPNVLTTCEVRIRAGHLIPRPQARHLLTIVSEALDNAARHAEATRVRVCAQTHAGDVLRITVQDDGRGLPPGLDLDALRDTGHFGLLGMTERAEFLGARLALGPGEQGRGTEVRLDVPVRQPTGEERG
jgi:signal transduction histidine kinase